ncbi:hypothetical protein KJ980_06935 [Patescibacteria group bacterium]|nr:hypothetical protein [Patescibacteria group bacterium]MBU4016538.1 hypothetical protein [Patescibacteria group bacterium]MBU4099355.1 hypothetical protein [Patescibacteria group bacterium]
MKSISLLKRYAKMSGDKKIRLGLTLSQAVRKVRQDGINAAQQKTTKRLKELAKIDLEKYF